MAYSTQTARQITEVGSIEWVAQRVRDGIVVAAGIALALPLILPFA